MKHTNGLGALPRHGYSSPVLEAKRQAALAYLGERWIQHPNHKPRPKHNCEPDVRALAAALSHHQPLTKESHHAS